MEIATPYGNVDLEFGKARAITIGTEDGIETVWTEDKAYCLTNQSEESLINVYVTMREDGNLDIERTKEKEKAGDHIKVTKRITIHRFSLAPLSTGRLEISHTKGNQLTSKDMSEEEAIKLIKKEDVFKAINRFKKIFIMTGDVLVQELKIREYFKKDLKYSGFLCYRYKHDDADKHESWILDIANNKYIYTKSQYRDTYTKNLADNGLVIEQQVMSYRPDGMKVKTIELIEYKDENDERFILTSKTIVDKPNTDCFVTYSTRLIQPDDKDYEEDNRSYRVIDIHPVGEETEVIHSINRNNDNNKLVDELFDDEEEMLKVEEWNEDAFEFLL